jgi:hypothetical protein
MSHRLNQTSFVAVPGRYYSVELPPAPSLDFPLGGLVTWLIDRPEQEPTRWRLTFQIRKYASTAPISAWDGQDRAKWSRIEVDAPEDEVVRKAEALVNYLSGMIGLVLAIEPSATHTLFVRGNWQKLRQVLERDSSGVYHV